MPTPPSAAESIEGVDFQLTVAVDRYHRAIIAWNYESAFFIQQTIDALLDARFALEACDGPQEVA